MDWIDEFAEALRQDDGGVAFGEDERRMLLKLAREVAHRTERVFAPLSTYLVGRFVAERVGGVASAADAIREAFAIAEETLPPPG